MAVPPELYPTKLEFTISAFPIPFAVHFAWGNDELRYQWTDLHSQVSSQGTVKPDADAWRAFWTDIRVIGVWHWRKPRYEPIDLTVLDGMQWSLDLEVDDKRLATAGDNAFPPDCRLEPSEAFKQLLRAFGRLIDDPQFIGYWYYNNGAGARTSLPYDTGH